MADVNPITNKEMVIAKNSGDSRYSDVTAITHEEMIIEKYLSGGGGGGTSDYTDLENKPKINSVELSGNKSWSDLGLANPMHIAGRVDTVSELPQTASVGDVYLVGLTAAEKDEYVYTTTGWEYIGASMIPVDSELSPTSENPVQNKVVNSALTGKQSTIDSSHKLDADLVDDTNSNNKFVTSAEKTTISKAITTDDIGLGTDYFVYNGIRVYISATEPTGTIPDGSIWIGG